MCMNRKYTDEERNDLDKMTMYAKLILQGITLEDIALDEDTTVEFVEGVIEKIKNVNPDLYRQVKEKLGY